MPKTAAQKAARRRRRAARVKSLTVPVMSPQQVAQIMQAANSGKRNRKKKRKSRGNRSRANRQGEISNRGKVNALNSLATDGVNSSRVIVNNSTIEDTFQVRREKIANVNGSSAFTIAQQLYINPGNSVMFPIFSQIAATYEEYRINKMEITFETEAYTASGSTLGAGKVIQVTNFDPDDGNFTNDTAAENYSGSVRGPPYASTCHDVLAAHRKKGRGGSMRDFSLNNYFVYTSTNQLAPVTGQGKFYDAGNYQLITQGNAASTEMGELYVTYSFTMIRPKQPENGAGGFVAGHFYNGAADATDASPLGLTSYTSFVARVGSSISIVDSSTLAGYSSTTVGFNNSSDAVLTLPNADATWLLQIYHTGANIAAIPSWILTSGAAAVSTYNGDTSSGVGFFTAAGTSATLTKVITTTYDGTPVPGNTNTVTLTGLTGMTGGKVDIWLVRLPTTLVTVMEKEESPVYLANRVVEEQARRMDLLAERCELLMAKLALMSPCESPSERKEADLEKSVHISRKDAKKLGIFGM